MEYYSAIKDKVLIPATTWINLENIRLSPQKSIYYCAISFLGNIQNVLELDRSGGCTSL